MDYNLDSLFSRIQERKISDSSSSYTAKLLEKGTPHCAKKLGEEAVETVIAAVSESNEKFIAESADLLYHFCVLLTSKNIDLQQVYQELQKREAQSGLAEKASRKN